MKELYKVQLNTEQRKAVMKERYKSRTKKTRAHKIKLVEIVIEEVKDVGLEASVNESKIFKQHKKAHLFYSETDLRQTKVAENGDKHTYISVWTEFQRIFV